MTKRGALQISFGMLFSVILIVAFIVVAFYAINVFLNLQKCSEMGLYKSDLQSAVDRAWLSEEASEIFEAKVPSNIDFACFSFFSNHLF